MERMGKEGQGKPVSLAAHTGLMPSNRESDSIPDQAAAVNREKTNIDLNRLTDQVVQKLERKILVEKERRGWS